MSYHKRANTDANQGEIVEALRKVGASVQLLHMVGGGCPDLLVGFQGVNWLLEVKDGRQKPSDRKLNERQKKWHAEWNGESAVVLNVLDALVAIGAIERPQTYTPKREGV